LICNAGALIGLDPTFCAATAMTAQKDSTTLRRCNSLKCSRHLRNPDFRRWKMAPPSPAFPKLNRLFNGSELIIIVQRLGEALE
jgi:hypothetical protein